MSDQPQTTVIAKPGISSGVVSFVNLLLVGVIIWQSLSMGSLAHKAAEKEAAVVRVTNNYYSFLQWVKNNMEDIRQDDRAMGVLPTSWRRRIFGDTTKPVDLSEWEDPLR